jgi:hypothetical protein
MTPEDYIDGCGCVVGQSTEIIARSDLLAVVRNRKNLEEMEGHNPCSYEFISEITVLELRSMKLFNFLAGACVALMIGAGATLAWGQATKPNMPNGSTAIAPAATSPTGDAGLPALTPLPRGPWCGLFTWHRVAT